MRILTGNTRWIPSVVQNPAEVTTARTHARLWNVIIGSESYYDNECLGSEFRGPLQRCSLETPTESRQ